MKIKLTTADVKVGIYDSLTNNLHEFTTWLPLARGQGEKEALDMICKIIAPEFLEVFIPSYAKIVKREKWEFKLTYWDLMRYCERKKLEEIEND